MIITSSLTLYVETRWYSIVTMCDRLGDFKEVSKESIQKAKEDDSPVLPVDIINIIQDIFDDTAFLYSILMPAMESIGRLERSDAHLGMILVEMMNIFKEAHIFPNQSRQLFFEANRFEIKWFHIWTVYNLPVFLSYVQVNLYILNIWWRRRSKMCTQNDFDTGTLIRMNSRSCINLLNVTMPMNGLILGQMGTQLHIRIPFNSRHW